MRAVVYRGVNDLRVETVPVPEIQRDEILVKVAVCGVCPTDIKKIQYGTVPPPRIFGHETSGTIVKIGPDVSRLAQNSKLKIQNLKVGDRVGLHHHVPCMKCHFCRHKAFAQCPSYKKNGITAGFEPAGGGYAEYVRVMNFCLPGVVKIPAKNSFEEGAMLEPVNTVLKAVNRLSLLRGDHVLVVGQGPIGLMFTRILFLHGMKVTATDLLPERLKLAREFGAHQALNPQEKEYPARVKSKNFYGFDAAVIAVPVDAALLDAQELVRGGGQVLLFAHTRRGTRSALDLSNVCVDEKDLLGSYSSDFTLQAAAARLVFSRKLNVHRLITHSFTLEQTADAVALAALPTPESLKVVVRQIPTIG